MNALTIFYDPHCGLCAKFRTWLESQPKRVAVEFLGYDSAEAANRFPGLMKLGADREVVVMSDDGHWWQGTGAWLTCLWATFAYHDWSYRLASPALQPLVRKAVHLISENRLSLSRLFSLKSDIALAESLHSMPEAECSDAACKFSPNQPFTP
jgi:predicted DCC family thiol-disulfide oxidoreductase YuxK